MGFSSFEADLALWWVFGVWKGSRDVYLKPWSRKQPGRWGRRKSWRNGITFKLCWSEGCLDGDGQGLFWGFSFVGNCFRGEQWVLAGCGENGDFSRVFCDAASDSFSVGGGGGVGYIVSWSDFHCYISFQVWLLSHLLRLFFLYFLFSFFCFAFCRWWRLFGYRWLSCCWSYCYFFFCCFFCCSFFCCFCGWFYCQFYCFVGFLFLCCLSSSNLGPLFFRIV